MSHEVLVDASRPVWLYKEPGSNGEPYAPVTFVNTSESAAPSQPAEPSATAPTEPGSDDTDVPIANPPRTGNGALASGAVLTGLLCCAAGCPVRQKEEISGAFLCDALTEACGIYWLQASCFFRFCEKAFVFGSYRQNFIVYNQSVKQMAAKHVSCIHRQNPGDAQCEF